MNQQNIALQRLRSQGITSPRLRTPSEVVAWLGAIQGQDYAGAKWSLGVRLPSSADADIERAFAEGSIVRTWAMRGTLHVVAATDVRWLLALLAPRIIASCARRYKELELDEPTLARSNTLLAQALDGGKQLTRKELLALLEDNGISTAGQRAAYMLQRASLDSLICHGVTRNNNPTYSLLDHAIPPANPIERDEALAILAQRYFISRGPATLQDFAHWSGLPIGEVRRGLASIASQLVQETIEGQVYWMGPQQSEMSAAQSVYLLPGFDEYLLGYRDRSAALEPQFATRIVPGGNGIFFSTIVSNGRVVGIWKRVFKKNTAILTPQFFYPVSEVEMHALHEAAMRYGRFLQMPVSVADNQ